MAGIIGMAVTVMAAILFYMFLKRKEDKPVTVQDLIGKKTKVGKNGIIQHENHFRAAVEVWPVNMTTSSKMEQNTIWLNFRLLLNTLGIPYTLLYQSQYLDILDYTGWYREQCRDNDFLTPGLKESGEDVAKYLEKLGEDKKTRDFRGYVLLHFDPAADNIDSGVKTGSFMLDDLIEQVARRQAKMTEDEMEDLARQVLEEAVQTVLGFCEQAGMQYRQLGRQEIYNLAYHTLQKDFANVARLGDAVEAESFTAQVESLTKKLVQIEYGGEEGA